MSANDREELGDKLISLDMEIKDTIEKIKIQETYLRVHDMDQQEIEMENYYLKLKKEGQAIERITPERQKEIKIKRLGIVQNINNLNAEKDALMSEKQEVEKTILTDFLERIDGLIKEAPNTCIVCDPSRGILDHHLAILSEVRETVVQGLTNKFELHPMRYKSHNFYYILQKEEDGMDVTGLKGVSVRHCDVPYQKNIMICVGELKQEPNRITMNDRNALVVSDLGNFSFCGSVDGRGQRHGSGACVYSDGIVYEGEFSKNKREGHGTVFFPNGEKYAGEFHQDKIEQQGTWYYLSGDCYKGEFRNGIRTGFGKMFFADGNTYEGEWKNDKPDGLGTAEYSDGLIYKGEFKCGVRYGRGKVHNGEGGFYEGGWKEDEKHGDGFVQFPTEIRYTGKWQDGVRKGPTNTFSVIPAAKKEESRTGSFAMMEG